MSRRALRSWARRQSRLVLVLRSRHPLLRRLPPGQRILEALGLARRRTVVRRQVPRVDWREEPVGPPERDLIAAPDALAPAVPEPAPEPEHGRAEADTMPSAPAGAAEPPAAVPQPGDPPRRGLPANWPPESVVSPAAADRTVRRDRGEPSRPSAASPPPPPPPRGPRPMRLEPPAGLATEPSGIAPAPARPAAAPPAMAPQPAAEPPAAADQGARPGLESREAPETRSTPPIRPAEAWRSPVRPAEPTARERVETAPVAAGRSGPPPPAPPGPAPAAAVSEAATGLPGHAEAFPPQEAAAPAGTEASTEVPGAGPGATEPSAEPPSARPQLRPGGTPHASSPPGAIPWAVEERRARRHPAAPAEGSTRPATEAKAEPIRREATPPPGAEPLFAPGKSRPIAEWRRLLIEATTEPARSPTPQPRAAATAARSEPVVRRAPGESEPVLESTRRFLRPLVGIDPATVRVHRGPAAARAAEAAGADALAWGEEVVLPPTHDERTPGGLGLLAHELTHVARRREPRFVPPIARGPGRAAPGARGRHPAEPAAGGEEGPLDEEGMAGRVERLVRAQAREAEKVPAEPASSAAPPDPAAAGPGRPAETPAPVAPAPPAAPAAPGPWGELPAPWEPMPPLDGAGMTGAAGPAPVFRAATDRGEEEPASPPAGAAPAAEAPAPDLDALARQVYDVLKRRLAAERRREG